MFPEMTMINRIQTQGRNQGADHVTLYKLEYTLDGTTWETVNNDVGVEQVLYVTLRKTSEERIMNYYSFTENLQYQVEFSVL